MKIDTLDDSLAEGLTTLITYLANWVLDPDPQETCDNISQGIANYPYILDWIKKGFHETDEYPDYKEIMARILTYFRKDQEAIQYLKTLKNPMHSDLKFKRKKPEVYQPIRVPDSEVIRL